MNDCVMEYVYIIGGSISSNLHSLFHLFQMFFLKAAKCGINDTLQSDTNKIL